MKFNQEEGNQLIRQRRSTFPKDYPGKRVDDDTIQQMLENANWAPTHRLTEPWRFVVFSGEGVRKLPAFQAECYRKVTIADGPFNENRYQGLLTKPMESSHIIYIGMKRDEKKLVTQIEDAGAV